MTPWNLLALPPLPVDLIRRLLAPLGDRVSVRAPATRDRAALLAALPEAEIVLGDWTGELTLDAAAVAAAPRLAFLQQPSVGVDGHDLAALAAAGVPVANTAGVSAGAVAEWCVAAALAVTRKLAAADAAVRAGEWPQQALQPRELGGPPGWAWSATGRSGRRAPVCSGRSAAESPTGRARPGRTPATPRWRTCWRPVTWWSW
ncbi:hypothetical protein ACFSTC_13235 [Nonomuraea ferruginea]